MSFKLKHIRERLLTSHFDDISKCLYDVDLLKDLTELDVRHFRDEEFFNMFVDKIYILTLKRLQHKYIKVEQQLKKAKIYNYEIFWGVDCKTKDEQKRWETRDKDCNISTNGSYSILMSMKLLLENAKQRNFNRIIVLQDDVILSKNFCKRFYEFYNKMYFKKNIIDNWKLIYFGASQHIWTDDIEESKNYYKDFYIPTGNTDGAFAIAINSLIFDLLIKQIDKKDLPFDSGALSFIQRTYLTTTSEIPTIFVIYPNIIISNINESELRGKRLLTTTASIFQWKLSMFPLNNVVE